MATVQFVMDAEGSRAISTFAKLAQQGDRMGQSAERAGKKTEKVGTAAKAVDNKMRSMAQGALAAFSSFASIGTILNHLKELDKTLGQIAGKQSEIAGSAGFANLAIINPGREKEAITKAIALGTKAGVDPKSAVDTVLTLQSQLGSLEAGLEAAPAAFQASKLMGTEGSIEPVIATVKGGQAKGLTSEEAVLATGIASGASLMGFPEIAATSPASGMFQTFQMQQMTASALSELIKATELTKATEMVARQLNFETPFMTKVAEASGTTFEELNKLDEVGKLRAAREAVPVLAGEDDAARNLQLGRMGVQVKQLQPLALALKNFEKIEKLMKTFEESRQLGGMGTSIENAISAFPPTQAAEARSTSKAQYEAATVTGQNAADFTRLGALAAIEQATAVSEGREMDIDPNTGELNTLPGIAQLLRSPFTGEDRPVWFERMFGSNAAREEKAIRRRKRGPGDPTVEEDIAAMQARREEWAADAVNRLNDLLSQTNQRFESEAGMTTETTPVVPMSEPALSDTGQSVDVSTLERKDSGLSGANLAAAFERFTGFLEKLTNSGANTEPADGSAMRDLNESIRALNQTIQSRRGAAARPATGQFTGQLGATD